MSEITEFSVKDIKPLRNFFNLLWISLLSITLVFLYFTDNKNPWLAVPESEYLKSIVIIISLATIPAVFGWFTMKLKKLKVLDSKDIKLRAYEKIWKIRALVVFVVLVINVISYILVYDKSMALMVVIAAFVFMYCRPSANALKNELNDIPKY